MADWTRSQGSQIHSIKATLSDSNGPLDIPPGTTVLFQGRRLGEETPVISGQGIVVRPGAMPDDPNRGSVRYDLTSSDSEQIGIFYCRWTLTPPYSSISQSFPEDYRMVLLITPST